MTLLSCRKTWERMNEVTTSRPMRNFQANIKMNEWLVETDLFPREALEAYSAWNLEKEIPLEARKKYFNAHRGGGQGDYRDGMRGKIANVIDCLTQYPASKRAVITIPKNSRAPHTSDDDAKCLREIHFYLEDEHLNATLFVRAQAAEIFPKNIHFIGELMFEIAMALGKKPGQLFYLATNLVSDRF